MVIFFTKHSTSLMKSAFILSLLCTLFSYSACSPGVEQDKEETADLVSISNGELNLLFKAEKVEGTFVLYDLKADQYFIHNEERANKGFLPASTFKIPNSLIALETGVIRDEKEIIPWDGIDRGVTAWNKDHDLRSAIKVSAVWFYQDLARKIGKGRIQYWIRRAEYGNQKTGEKIDAFWLTGDLQISAMEQINFLKQFYTEQLDFSKRSVSIVKDILIEEKTPEYTLSAKTGWATITDPETGWYVGYEERGDNVYFFALNMDINKNDDAKKRKTLTRKILKIASVL